MGTYSVRNEKRGSWVKILIIGFLLTLMLILAGGFFVVRTYNRNLEPASANQKRVTFTVSLGSSVTDIARSLKDNGLIRSTWAFEYYVRNQNKQSELKAGTYALQASQSVPEIVDIISQGKISTNLITITPGQRIDQVREILMDYGFDQTEVENGLNPVNHKDNPVLNGLPRGATLEGFIYPESFQKDSNLTVQELVEKYLNEMNKQLTPAIKKGIAKQGLTTYQGIILASIIEQEVSTPEDRKIVAQVFLKRLKENIPLGADATAPYGAILAGAPPSIFYDSPYNTHKNPGLPPGPISNVSRSSLEAVASPSSTDWLYFVSGDDGTTHFSKTLQEHEALTQQYCKVLCASSE